MGWLGVYLEVTIASWCVGRCVSCKVRRPWFRQHRSRLRTVTAAVRCRSSSSTVSARVHRPPLSWPSTVTCRTPGSSSPASTATVPRTSLKNCSAGARHHVSKCSCTNVDMAFVYFINKQPYISALNVT